MTPCTFCALQRFYKRVQSWKNAAPPGTTTPASASVEGKDSAVAAQQIYQAGLKRAAEICPVHPKEWTRDMLVDAILKEIEEVKA